jgi:hypothetical protein
MLSERFGILMDYFLDSAHLRAGGNLWEGRTREELRGLARAPYNINRKQHTGVF